MLRLRTILMAAACFAAAACTGGSKAPSQSLVKVTGKVLANNKPVTGAVITFTPADTKGEATTGQTGPDGSYTLMTPRGQTGAVPGTYRVTLSRMVGSDGKELPAGTSPYTGGAKETIPPVYSTVEQTTLITTVPADRDTVTLDFPLQANLR